MHCRMMPVEHQHDSDETLSKVSELDLRMRPITLFCDDQGHTPN